MYGYVLGIRTVMRYSDLGKGCNRTARRTTTQLSNPCNIHLEPVETGAARVLGSIFRNKLFKCTG